MLIELAEHLGAEEERVLPLASHCLTQAEWNQLGEEGLGTLPKSQLPLAFGMLMKDADPEVIRGILANVPLIPRVVLPRIGPRVYSRYTRRLTRDRRSTVSRPDAFLCSVAAIVDVIRVPG